MKTPVGFAVKLADAVELEVKISCDTDALAAMPPAQRDALLHGINRVVLATHRDASLLGLWAVASAQRDALLLAIGGVVAATKGEAP